MNNTLQEEDIESFDFIEITSITSHGMDNTYDIEVDEVHLFTARNDESGFESISHNSATICLFSPNDEEMINAKTGNWFIENPQRGRSNNSALLIRNQTSREDFAKLISSTKQFGEPGFVWADSTEIGYNPCVEIGLYPVAENGEHGVQFCNLTEINGKYCSTEEKFLQACRASAIIGTLQASYTNFRYLSDASRRITEREALLGCSITGMMDNPDILFNSDIQRRGAEEIKRVNKKIAEIIGINPAARTSAVKPAGCLLPSTKVRTNKGDMSLLDIFEANGCLEVLQDAEKNGKYNIWIDVDTDIKIYNKNNELEDIIKLYINGEHETYTIALEDGSEVTLTGNHKVMLSDKRWKRADELEEGDTLLCQKEKSGLDILHVTKNDDLRFTVDLETAETHSYQLANGCVSHNTTSCVLGTASGIHPHHARRYIRHVQANKLEFPAQYFQKMNPLAVKDSVWSNNGTDVVIAFLCEVPTGAIIKNQLKAVELLDKVKTTQQNWVEHGTNYELCAIPNIRHNVSNTITVKPNEWDDVEEYIYNNREWFAGISLLPASGDKDYPQAPLTTVHTPSEIVSLYGDGCMFASGLIVDGLRVFNDNLWRACDCVLGFGESIDNDPEKQEWVRRAKQFAERYFSDDMRKMTYCLKDVYIWKQWCDLSREYKDINWGDVVEDTEHFVDIDTIGAQACAGGKCEVSW
jgi:hypothetical protein